MGLWTAIKVLPFSDRHGLYGASIVKDFSKPSHIKLHYEIAHIECCANYEVKKLLKRVANEKKSSKHVGRQLAKIAHAVPLTLFDIILSQVEAYDNMILPLIDCFFFMTPLGLDVLAYLLPTRLESVRPKLQLDGMNVARWFQNLSRFTGAFYKAYPSSELGSMIEFFFKRCVMCRYVTDSNIHLFY